MAKTSRVLSHDYQGRFQTSQLNISDECTNFNGIEIKRENAHKYSKTILKIYLQERTSRAAKDPMKGQLSILRHIIGYLKHKPSMSIVFDGNGIDKVRIEANTHVHRQSSKHQTDVKQLVHEETR